MNHCNDITCPTCGNSFCGRCNPGGCPVCADKKVEIGKASAARILVADELGLNPGYVPLAKMYLDGKLYVSQYGRLEIGGIKAVELINNAGLQSKAMELSEKYFQ